MLQYFTLVIITNDIMQRKKRAKDLTITVVIYLITDDLEFVLRED